MKLTFNNPFTLETDDGDYSGTYADLTKKQTKAFTKKFKELNEKVSSIVEIEGQIRDARDLRAIYKAKSQAKELIHAIDSLSLLHDELHSLSEGINQKAETETIYKERVKISLSGEDTAVIMQLGEDYGFEVLHRSIMSDIAEKAKKKD